MFFSFRFGFKTEEPNGGRDTRLKWPRLKRNTIQRRRKWRKVRKTRRMMNITNLWTRTPTTRKSQDCWKSTRRVTCPSSARAVTARTLCDDTEQKTLHYHHNHHHHLPQILLGKRGRVKQGINTLFTLLLLCFECGCTVRSGREMYIYFLLSKLCYESITKTCQLSLIIIIITTTI